MRRPPPWIGQAGTATVRTLVLSPDTLFGEAISMCLSANDGLEVVGLAVDPSTLEGAVEVLRPTVLVCDQRASGPTLHELVARCRAVHEPMRSVLLATVAGATRVEAAAFDAIVPQRSSLDRVVAAVREVAWYQRSPVEETSYDPAPELSGRELEVLHLLARGIGTGPMAEQLHLSPHTIRNHVRRLMAKLDVSSRLEAVTEGRRLGII